VDCSHPQQLPDTDDATSPRRSKDLHAATRDGRELEMQVGVRLFWTDEAILTPDWVPNECIICVYNAADREFYWSNRLYAACRKSYNERVKQSVDRWTPRMPPWEPSAKHEPSPGSLPAPLWRYSCLEMIGYMPLIIWILPVCVCGPWQPQEWSCLLT